VVLDGPGELHELAKCSSIRTEDSETFSKESKQISSFQTAPPGARASFQLLSGMTIQMWRFECFLVPSGRIVIVLPSLVRARPIWDEIKCLSLGDLPRSGTETSVCETLNVVPSVHGDGSRFRNRRQRLFDHFGSLTGGSRDLVFERLIEFEFETEILEVGISDDS
jgi:hypothetical protein